VSDQFEAPFGIEAIKKLIPHRYPFLFVDRILEYEKGSRIVAIKNVTGTESYLQGHFPGNPVVPGVLQVEAVAQTATVLGKLTEMGSAGVLLTEISEARFKRVVVPGDTMTLIATIVKRRQTFFWFEGEVQINGEIAANVKFSAKLLV
jgi:beta-hydroxyacyl-ACP dehydratase FabZ